MTARRGPQNGSSALDLFEGPRLGTSVRRLSGIESRFDVAFVADLALREKQVQQNYRPVIAVHKWFARRPGTLFRALLLSEFGEGALAEDFYRPHSLAGLRVADPFMGGGTPLVEANRLGCDVVGFDINPMAWWIVRQEIESIDLHAYTEAAERVLTALDSAVGALYRTRCEVCGRPDAKIKYFLWVKVQRCTKCGSDFDAFPGYLVAEDSRHTANVVCCARCGALAEVRSLEALGECPCCSAHLGLEGPAKRGKCLCPRCATVNQVPAASGGVPRHRMFAIEYHCDHCRGTHQGRFFKRPDAEDTARYAEAEQRAIGFSPHFAPDDPIPPGDETNRLLRWGYREWRHLFNARQVLGLELLCRQVATVPDDRVRDALATNVSDMLRYQNMLCRYDTWALKSLDIFSVHGFPVGLVQCESNLLGIRHAVTRTNVGSGGWTNIVEKFRRAKEYCERPFEVGVERGRKVVRPILGEWIGGSAPGTAQKRSVQLHCGSSTESSLPPASLDAVFTDPPYFANVQYAELMDFCYAWLRRLIDGREPAFCATSTRNAGELTGNATLSRGLDNFAAGLSSVFCRMAQALKEGAPLAFTYHHNSIDAYAPIAVGLLDAGLTCTASLPAPGEMGGSIHIHGTESSIIDTVFVCRTTGRVPRSALVETPAGVASLVLADLARLARGGVSVTRGDARCVAYGHLVRLAIWRTRPTWDKTAPWEQKLERVQQAVCIGGGWPEIEKLLPPDALTRRCDATGLREDSTAYGEPKDADAVDF